MFYLYDFFEKDINFFEDEKFRFFFFECSFKVIFRIILNFYVKFRLSDWGRGVCIVKNKERYVGSGEFGDR